VSWRKTDPTNGPMFPYYTEELLDELINWDMREWRVFEYSGGDSTLWWRDKCRECISIDTDREWCNSHNLIHIKEKEPFINYPQQIVQDGGEKFDCIIIDQGRTPDGSAFRDETTEVAIQCIKNGGTLIIDNWKQNTIPDYGENCWKKSEKALINYKSKIYKHPSHQDWKTAVWWIQDR